MTVSRISRFSITLLVCAMALMLVACGTNSDQKAQDSTQDSKVVGTWTLSQVKEADGTPYSDEKMATIHVTYEFSPDTLKEDWGNGEKHESPYTLSEDGHTATVTYEDGHTETLEFNDDFSSFSLLYENKAEPEYWGRTYTFVPAS